MVPSDETRAKIGLWIASAPDTRLVETTHSGDCWMTQALEDGEIRFEERECGIEEPELDLLAAWCAREGKKIEPRPPVKTSGVPASEPARMASEPARMASEPARRQKS